MSNHDHVVTAERRFHGSTVKVHVLIDGREEIFGGKRAERAAAVIITHWPKETSAGAWGLRQDLAKAQAEAHRLVTNTTLRTRSRFGGPSIEIPINRPDEAFAVAVTESDAGRVAHGRREDEPCEKGTVGCSIAHTSDSACETW